MSVLRHQLVTRISGRGAYQHASGKRDALVWFILFCFHFGFVPIAILRAVLLFGEWDDVEMDFPRIH